VVTVFDFGLAGDTRAFLVMELLEGTTVREELQRQRRLAAPRTVEVLRGVCAAVEVAHRRQLIHRDLKPENIFLVRGETPELAKVLDFGIAKFLPTTTQAPTETGTGSLAGTLAYMAPEQLRGGSASLSWDLWALAIIAYEMLTGAHPFASTNLADFHLAVLAGRFKPVDQHLPDAPARWHELFTRAFALEPADRPNSARAFLAELEHALL
jgi:eukaryotic-like serine/threonine-protein kinase